MRRFLPILAFALVPMAAFSVPPAVDPDPEHVANRLIRHLYSRTPQDGKRFNAESLEPLFVQHSKFLTEGDSHRKALALLDEFVKTQAEKPIKDPLRRAILQRDLWGVFAVTAGTAGPEFVSEASGKIYAHTERFADTGDADLDRLPQRRELQRRLARALRAVALTPAEIRALPDNLDAAVQSRTFAPAFDPDQAQRPMLPSDLFAADGPWVPITSSRRDDGMAAPEHMAFTKGRSVFIVLLRLPKGRAATEAFVKEVDVAARKGDKLPPMPDDAQTALVRRMVLIDDKGRFHESRLTESVEVRVYHQTDVGHPFAFHLRRGDLFAGRAGGLHAIGPEEESLFDFQVAVPKSYRSADPLEREKPEQPHRLMETCSGCHRRKEGDGIHTIATLHAGRTGRDEHRIGLRASTAEEQERATARWLQRSYTWGLLQGMWDTPRP